MTRSRGLMSSKQSRVGFQKLIRVVLLIITARTLQNIHGVSNGNFMIRKDVAFREEKCQGPSVTTETDGNHFIPATARGIVLTRNRHRPLRRFSHTMQVPGPVITHRSTTRLMAARGTISQQHNSRVAVMVAARDSYSRMSGFDSRPCNQE